MELTEQLTVVVQSNRDGGAIINFRIIEFKLECFIKRVPILNRLTVEFSVYTSFTVSFAGIAQRLVLQPSKLKMWVRFPLPAPPVLLSCY